MRRNHNQKIPNKEKFTVTRIEAQKKRSYRYSIYLDGEFAFGLDREVLYENPLHTGDELSQSEIDKLLHQEEIAQAKGKALSLISYRARSVEEISERLSQKRFSESVISGVIEALVRAGLLDDRQFANAYIHTRMAQKPMSKRLLKKELRRKGIKDEIIQEAVENEYGDASEAEVAAQLADRRRKNLPSDKKKAARRLSDYLRRRGFSWSVVRPIVDETVQDGREQEDYEST